MLSSLGQKNDAADAICEAAGRPTMHFVTVKTEEQQARGMLFRTRDLLVRQRTQLINALRGHLAEYGVVAPQGRANIRDLGFVVDEATTSLPLLVASRTRSCIAPNSCAARKSCAMCDNDISERGLRPCVIQRKAVGRAR
jgi:transposase